MKKYFTLTIILAAFFLNASSCNLATSKNNAENSNGTDNITSVVDTTGSATSDPIIHNPTNSNKGTKIQVAILLDTSSSMDGLIEQAKSRLWNIVNTLTTLKYNGKAPQIEIALYEYGNDGISNDNYIRQKTAMTSDLDLISQQLFALTTYGGLEYCGAVINEAVKSLKWGTNDADMKLIYIAGNESFAQGNMPYKTAIKKALEKGIYVNTIHCGHPESGISDLWKDGATVGKGKYFNIDHNVRVRHIDTPYDDRISACNMRLNNTYIGYGRIGQERKETQMAQDMNAEKVSKSNYAERAVSKTKSVYNNSSWDLVDKVKADKKALSEIKESELPVELQGKTKAELEKVVAEKTKEREAIQKEISDLAKKRQEYIDQKLKETDPDADDLGNAINSSIMELAKIKGYTAEK